MRKATSIALPGCSLLCRRLMVCAGLQLSGFRARRLGFVRSPKSGRSHTPRVIPEAAISNHRVAWHPDRQPRRIPPHLAPRVWRRWANPGPGASLLRFLCYLLFHRPSTPPPRDSPQPFPPFSSVWGGDRWPLHEYESALDAFYRSKRSKRRRNLCFLSFLLFNPSHRRTNFAQLRLPGFCTGTPSKRGGAVWRARRGRAPGISQRRRRAQGERKVTNCEN
jgi:hypothetical protein